jgi:hypothetical protein
MQRLEVSGAVYIGYISLGGKVLKSWKGPQVSGRMMLSDFKTIGT